MKNKSFKYEKKQLSKFTSGSKKAKIVFRKYVLRHKRVIFSKRNRNMRKEDFFKMVRVLFEIRTSEKKVKKLRFEMSKWVKNSKVLKKMRVHVTVGNFFLGTIKRCIK